MPPELFWPFILRPILALLTRTFFQPDEYFQALEPAHRIVFGYGRLTWEWVSEPPIRSIAYPAVWVPVYWILKVTGFDQGTAIITAPKLLAGLFAAGTDYATYHLARRVLGPRYAIAALFLSLLSFFNVLALARTLSNSMETFLTTASLCFWPLRPESLSRREYRLALATAALACAVRPTSAIVWVFMFGQNLWHSNDLRQRAALCIESVIVGSIALAALVIVDTAFYGKPTLTPLNFFLTNMSSVSMFYGQNPWHYYLSQAIPILCTTTIWFTIRGAMISAQDAVGRRLLGVTAWTIGVYSLVSHKEWRFIHPLLPIFHVFAAKYLVDTYSATRLQGRTSHSRLPIIKRHLFLILSSIPASIYVLRYHGSAQIAVMYHLRSLPPTKLHSLGFLMPCHSTPWQTYLHRPDLEGGMWALGCEPPNENQSLETYKDQTTEFYLSPFLYIRDRFPKIVDPTFPPSAFPSSPPGVSDQRHWSHTWPSHIVLFGALLDVTEDGITIRQLLIETGYAETWKVGNGWEEDEKRRGGVSVWEWSIE